VRDATSVRETIAQAIERCGRIGVLCNNAGIKRYRVADDYTLEDWQAIIDSNLLGPFLCSKYALPHLQQRTRLGSQHRVRAGDCLRIQR
jgi:NAD(P)-dependent dehydrogenase (short-subunit alcohol dehydrogenase family)